MSCAGNKQWLVSNLRALLRTPQHFQILNIGMEGLFLLSCYATALIIAMKWVFFSKKKNFVFESWNLSKQRFTPPGSVLTTTIDRPWISIMLMLMIVVNETWKLKPKIQRCCLCKSGKISKNLNCKRILQFLFVEFMSWLHQSTEFSQSPVKSYQLNLKMLQDYSN